MDGFGSADRKDFALVRRGAKILERSDDADYVVGARLHGIHVSAIIMLVIVSFADRATEALYHGEPRAAKRIPAGIRTVALRELDILNAAHNLIDLRSPPGNQLEALRGDLAGLHSIRINDQWRIVFRWSDAGPTDVRIRDYHS